MLPQAEENKRRKVLLWPSNPSVSLSLQNPNPKSKSMKITLQTKICNVGTPSSPPNSLSLGGAASRSGPGPEERCSWNVSAQTSSLTYSFSALRASAPRSEQELSAADNVISCVNWKVQKNGRMAGRPVTRWHLGFGFRKHLGSLLCLLKPEPEWVACSPELGRCMLPLAPPTGWAFTASHFKLLSPVCPGCIPWAVHPVLRLGALGISVMEGTSRSLMPAPTQLIVEGPSYDCLCILRLEEQDSLSSNSWHLLGVYSHKLLSCS